MIVFNIDDPSQGLGKVMIGLADCGITSDSRNGPVIRFPQPVSLVYKDPRRRILDHPIREANHFFHFFETLWMFAGLDTVAPLDPFNSGMKQYSDNGVTFEAPYGHRWRVKWGDQIHAIVEKLKSNPLDRRVVLQMWDPYEIHKTEGKDFACNQQCLFATRPDGEGGHYLDMMVTNRSNDLIYGSMGSNLFHFSMLLEYIACHAGLRLGTYTQTSVNLHLYLENPTSKRCWEHREEFGDWTSVGVDRNFADYPPTMDMATLKSFVNDPEYVKTTDRYIKTVASPITQSYLAYKDKSLGSVNARVDAAKLKLLKCASPSLYEACDAWFTRRYK